MWLMWSQRSKRLLTTSLAASLALGIAGPATPAPLVGQLRLASASDAGIKANFGVEDASTSADGSFVAFRSASTNLDPADADSTSDVYVKNIETGDIVLASASDQGVKGNSTSFFGFPHNPTSLSANGTRVVFQSGSTNLDPADRDFLFDVYVKDTTTGDVILASTSDTGVKGNGLNFVSCISGDGGTVAFVSTSTNLDPADTDSSTDLYVKDLDTGDIRLGSTSAAGVKGNPPVTGTCSLSADGTKVAFMSFASNLHPADQDIRADVFVKNFATGAILLATTNKSGVKADGSGPDPDGGVSLSADGSRVAFTTVSRNLDARDTDGHRDVYVKDLVTDAIFLASATGSGAKGNSSSQRVSLSAAGTSVAFMSSATNLDPGSAGFTDVYVKDVETGELLLVSASTSGVAGTGSDFQPALSGDGARVAFVSDSTNLHQNDTDSMRDLYVKSLDFTDVTPPVLALPDDIVVDAVDPAGTAVIFAASALDDTDGSVPAYCTPPSGTVFPVGITLVRCTASDSSGNGSSGEFTVRILGTIEQLDGLTASLGALVASEPGAALADKLEDALTKLKTTLEKLPLDRQGALGAMEGAAGDLDAAVADRLVAADAGSAMLNRLSGAARLVALVAVKDARDRTANAGKLADADAAVVSGDEARIAGRYKDAIARYRYAVAAAEGA